MDTNILFLQAIILLDSICFGITYPHVAPYIIILNGTQVHSGILAALTLACSLISENFTKRLSYIKGNKHCLLLILYMSLASHIGLILTNSVWFTILSRLLFAICNETQSYCRNLIFCAIPRENHERSILFLSILSSLGYVIGPVIGGYMFVIPQGFLLISFTAAMLTVINIVLLLNVDISQPISGPTSFNAQEFMQEIKIEIQKQIFYFMNSSYDENWDLISIKFLFTCSITIFSSKFTHILINNFDGNAILFGYANAYHNIITFLAVGLMLEIKNRYISCISLHNLTEMALFLHLASLTCICILPIYELYWMLCFPLIFTKSYINSVWTDIFSTRNNENLVNISSAVSVAAGMISPIIFGMICDIYCPHVVVFLSVIPIMCSIYIFKFCTKVKQKLE